MERLVVNGSIEVLDEDVTNARFAVRRVAERPHNAHRTASQRLVVEFFEGARSGIGVEGGVEIDVRIAQRTAGHGITAHTDGRNGANL